LWRKPKRFLHARLHIESLSRKLTIKALKKSMKSSEIGLADLYDDVIDRIKSQGEERADMAFKLLMWIVHAFRPLSIAEAQRALASMELEEDKTVITEEDLPSRELLLALCCGIVVVEGESDTIRLVHETTQAYLLRQSDHLFKDCHDEMLDTCLSYLSLDTLDDYDFEKNGASNVILSTQCFASYSALNLPDHYRRATSNSRDLKFSSRLKVKSSALNRSLKALARKVDFDSWGRLGSLLWSAYPETLSELAAYHGFVDLIKQLLREANEPKPNQLQMDRLLFFAVSRGQIETVELLLQAYEYGNTAMVFAVCICCSVGKLQILEILMKGQGLQINLDMVIDITEGPLWDNPSGVENQASNDQPLSGMTLIGIAAAGGNDEIVEFLIRAGVKHGNVPCPPSSKTPLHTAAHDGNSSIVQRLLDSFQLDINDPEIVSPRVLIDAASLGRSNVVATLLNKGLLNVDALEDYPWTAFTMACKKNEFAIAKTLLDTGRVDVNMTDQFGMTPMLWAASEGYYEIVELLLSVIEIDFGHKENSGLTALSLAAVGRHAKVVQLLIRSGKFDVHTRDHLGRTVLYHAILGFRLTVSTLESVDRSDSFNQREATIRALLKTGLINLEDAVDRSGQTPLELASELEDEDIMRFIRQSGAVKLEKTEEQAIIKSDNSGLIAHL
jgi:ankyrin repeat protein